MLTKDIKKKINDNANLNRGECLYLLKDCSIHDLGEMADEVNVRKNKGKVYFNVNRHINLTNVCVSRCKFCAFSRDKGEKGAYVFSIDDVLQKVKESMPMGITEVHIVSGLHPDLTFDYYLDILRAVKKFAPKLHIQGFTAVEIHYFAKITGFSITKVLEIMKEAGLDSLPGGGAEVFSARIREELCPKKATGQEWQEVMTEAHRLGLKSNATLLFGHIETLEEVADHLISLRDLQSKTGGFQSFIPLPFHPQFTPLENERNLHISANDRLLGRNKSHSLTGFTQMESFEKPTGNEILRMLAVSRLVLNNFSHIKAFWIMMGLRLAQLSLKYGVNDLDGTVVEEKITHSAGATTPEDIPRQELIRLIKEMDRIPVERDTLYNEIKVYS